VDLSTVTSQVSSVGKVFGFATRGRASVRASVLVDMLPCHDIVSAMSQVGQSQIT
jgi:hypothetical protein